MNKGNTSAINFLQWPLIFGCAITVAVLALLLTVTGCGSQPAGDNQSGSDEPQLPEDGLVSDEEEEQPMIDFGNLELPDAEVPELLVVEGASLVLQPEPVVTSEGVTYQSNLTVVESELSSTYRDLGNSEVLVDPVEESREYLSDMISVMLSEGLVEVADIIGGSSEDDIGMFIQAGASDLSSVVFLYCGFDYQQEVSYSQSIFRTEDGSLDFKSAVEAIHSFTGIKLVPEDLELLHTMASSVAKSAVPYGICVNSADGNSSVLLTVYQIGTDMETWQVDSLRILSRSVNSVEDWGTSHPGGGEDEVESSVEDNSGEL